MTRLTGLANFPEEDKKSLMEGLELAISMFMESFLEHTAETWNKYEEEEDDDDVVPNDMTMGELARPLHKQ